MEVSDQFHEAAVYPRGRAPWYPLDRTMDGASEPIWRRWWRRKVLAPPGNLTPVVQPVAESAYWLRYNDSCFIAADSKLITI